MEELIALYLNGEATPEQAMELEDWKSESPKNLEVFASLEKVYNATHQVKPFAEPDMAKAWERVRPRKKKEAKIRSLWTDPRVWAGAAAVAIIAFLLGVLWNQSPGSNPMAEDQRPNVPVDEEVVFMALEEKTGYTLQDDSKVQLEKGSKLVLAADFNKNGRHATLHGSGTFEVVHDESNVFVISVEGLEVVDVGTVFSIDHKGDTVKVVVSEGAVELRLNGKLLDVAAGDSAFYVISSQVIDRYHTPEARQDHVFVFDGTSLKEVASILSKFFNRKIVVMDEAIRECPLSVTFKNEELATILDIIRELLDVKIVRNEGIIGIYGKGCN